MKSAVPWSLVAMMWLSAAACSGGQQYESYDDSDGAGGSATPGGAGQGQGDGGTTGSGATGGTATGGTADGGASTGGTASCPPASAAPTERKKTSLGMGLAGVGAMTTQYPFLDFMKHATPWARGTDTNFDVDDSGWLRTVTPGRSATTFFYIFPDVFNKGSPLQYPRVVVRWKGKGTLSYHWCAKKVVAESTDDRHVVDLDRDASPHCILSVDATDPADPIREITIVPEEHVAAFDCGEVFNPDWLERIKDFRALRFMDWMQTNNSSLSSWSNRPLPTWRSYATAGVPAEVMIDLANKVGADPWFTMPHRGDDDFYRKFADLVKSRLAPHLRAYVEHSNEVWNPMFTQQHYAQQQGAARWGDRYDIFMHWHGMRTAQMCDIWKTSFGAAADRVTCALGTQAGWQGLEEAALDCSYWAAEGNPPCYQRVDALAITGYFSGCLASDDHVTLMRSWFKDADGGIAKGLQQADSGAHFSCTDTVSGNAATYTYFKNVASKKGLALLAYEGGQHITGNGHSMQDDQAFIDFHIGVNRAAGMKPLYDKNFTNWKNAGGTLFMHFVDIGYPSKWGSWGALEHVAQPSSPRWDAILQFNQTSCWWSGC